jgi:hypothetical protein
MSKLADASLYFRGLTFDNKKGGKREEESVFTSGNGTAVPRVFVSIETILTEQ